MNEPLGPGAVGPQPQQPGTHTEEHRLVEAARNEAERLRQLAEEAREVRDGHRRTLETVRQEQEHRRETAETARVANEQVRVAADTARQAVVDAVHVTADTLSTTLERMTVVEDLRRTLRDVRDVKKVDSN